MISKAIRRVKSLLGQYLNSIGQGLIGFGDQIRKNPSKLLERNKIRSLYKTYDGNLFWLDEQSYVDSKIIESGVFEPLSTNLVKKLVKEGDVVLDIGANIGYYSLIFSKLVGEQGQVLAFEPTNNFMDVLEQNIKINKANNISVHKLGFSDKSEKQSIDIGPSSATMHSPEGYDLVLGHEEIQLVTMDSFFSENPIEKIDFIKMDIDGHEPLVLNGGWSVLEQFKPIILCEISPLHYLEAGVTAWDFYDELNSRGVMVYHEKSMKKIETKNEFLRRCGDFSTTNNIVLSFRQLSAFH